MTVYAITDTKKRRTGIAPTYLQTTPIFRPFAAPGKCCLGRPSPPSLRHWPDPVEFEPSALLDPRDQEFCLVYVVQPFSYSWVYHYDVCQGLYRDVSGIGAVSGSRVLYPNFLLDS